MSYEQFVREVESVIRRLTEGSLQISIHTSIKNNGYERKGITFSEKGTNVSPTIYLEEYYAKYIQGASLERLAQQILEVYDKVRIERSWRDDRIQDYEWVKDKIIYKLVHRGRNRQLLRQIPYVLHLDLAIIFYVLVDVDEPGEQMATMLISNEHMRWWKVSAEDIYQRAVVNTEKLLPYEFCAMCVLIDEMLGYQDVDDAAWRELREQESMYILTNRIRNFGAAAMLYPGRLEMIGVYLKENYYILPSSVHELIVIPESKALPREEMGCIVKEVNETQVQPEEFLSDHVYYYDREQKKIAIR